MRKIILSLAVMVTFGLYAFHQRAESANVQVTVPSSKTSSSTSNTSSSSGSSSGSNSSSMMNGNQMMGGYKDGQYTGNSVDAYYGYIQVKAIISGGKITDVQFLDYPQDRNTSIEINSQAMPYLKQEAISAQSAQVDIVSGATDSSNAFRESLQNALDQAK